MDLSDRRAKMVGNYFRGKGINSSRFTTRGFGESQPVASNETQGGQYQNRRVELVVTER
ncbi:MAG: OmpA family protein [Calditrichia bacterium]